MARNSSVEKYRQLVEELKKEVRVEGLGELVKQAESLAELMRAVVPVGETGKLQASIRVEPGKKPGQVLVKAGGPTTTVSMRGGASASYDYAAGVEWGTQNAPAHAFFYPSYRLKKKRMRRSVKSKITRSINKRSAKA